MAESSLPKTEPVRVGFIGIGLIATRAHLPALVEMARAGEVVLQAFCDVNRQAAESAAREFGAAAPESGAATVYTDHHEMFERETLDAIYLCIPPTCHTDVELIAAERGIPLFVEKPQSLDIAQALEFGKAIQKAGILSQVGFQSRYYASAEYVRQMLAERTPRHALVQLLYSGKMSRHWTSRLELCGGTFVENTIHMVDLLRFLLGDIEAVSAFYVQHNPGESPGSGNMPRVYNVNYCFVNGLTANVTTSRVLTNTPASRREFTVVADDSLIEWSPARIIENEEIVWQMDSPPAPFAAHAAQAKAFIQAVRAGDPGYLRSPYPEALNSLAAVLGANASAARGGELILLEDLAAGSH